LLSRINVIEIVISTIVVIKADENQSNKRSNKYKYDYLMQSRINIIKGVISLNILIKCSHEPIQSNGIKSIIIIKFSQESI